MKNLLFFMAAVILFSACNNDSKVSENESLAKTDRTVIYEVLMDIDPDFTNWMGNIDKKRLLKSIFDQVENGELKAYDAMSTPGENIMSWESIIDKFGLADTVIIMDVETGEWNEEIYEPNIDYSEINGIIFIEEWKTNTKNEIIKEVLGVAPVRYYNIVYEDGEVIEKKSIVFVTYFGERMPELFEGY